MSQPELVILSTLATVTAEFIRLHLFGDIALDQMMARPRSVIGIG
jgi:hypothetical protein